MAKKSRKSSKRRSSKVAKCSASQVMVKGYTRKDGVHVKRHCSKVGKRKSHKGSRKMSRKGSRKSRKTSRKSRKSSRKSRKSSRKSRM